MIGRAAILALALCAPAVAQEDLRIDPDALYVTDPEACTALEEQGLDAWMEMSFLSLTFAGGIQSMEFHCNFHDVKGREGSTHLFIDAICEAPGEVYPDILAVTPYSEAQIQVVSAYDATLAATAPLDPSSAVATPGATLYTRCDNLSEIPVD